MNFVVSSLLAALSVFAADVNAFERDQSPYKALVFLSDDCPCSRSHIEHLNKLSREGLKIYGVISEPLNNSMSEERKKQHQDYFKKEKFEFPLIDDPQQTLVNTYKALKTPHATLFEKTESGYKIIYEGGVTNQKDFAKSTERYMEDNWNLLKQGKPMKYKNGFSLGCYIRRI